MNEPVVRITGVTKRFSGICAVDNLNMTISRGSVVALLGPNGAGKTTSIRMMLGLLRPDAGSIEVFGLNPRTHAVAIRRRCGYIPERPKMIPWMSVRRIMAFTSAFYPEWNHTTADSLLKQLNLKAHQKIQHLSRGEEARLALLLGLAFKPELLILDDATSGIDPAARRDILENIIQTIHESGTTIVFATHLLNEIEGLADEAVFLINGVVRYAGRVDTLKRTFKRVLSWNDASPPSIPSTSEVISEKITGRCTELVVSGFNPDDWKELVDSGQVEIQDLSLEDIYLACHDEEKRGRQ